MKHVSSRFFPWMVLLVGAVFLRLGHATAEASESSQVGRLEDGRYLVPTNQVLSPFGKQFYFPDRPHDIALSPDGKWAAVLGSEQILFLSASESKVLAATRYTKTDNGAGGSFKGIVFTPDGRKLIASNVGGALEVFIMGEQGRPTARNSIVFKDGDRFDLPSGLDIDPQGERVYVALNLSNSLAVVDLKSGEVTERIPVGNAPFDVCVHDSRAYVSNFGGDIPDNNDTTGPAGRGTEVKVDPVRYIASEGTVSIVDLETHEQVRSVRVGLHPSGLDLSPDGSRLYVACANSDTVSVIDTLSGNVVETISTRPDRNLIFGSAPNDLVLSRDGKRLYVSNGTNNCVCVLELGKNSVPRNVRTPTESSGVAGLIPTGWYPAGSDLSPDGFTLWVANIKGVGSRNQDRELAEHWRPVPGLSLEPRAFKDREMGFNTHDHSGSVSEIRIPDEDCLSELTETVIENNRMTETVSALAPPRDDVSPKPVPERHGEPSVFRHVVYIIKENRTYDQVFGDIPEGNGEPSLCMYGEEVTPNHHKLAREFVLLDNFYCSGILSADGHQWTDEAYTTSYIEKAFGGFPRSYPYDGGDSLAYASSGFIWDNCLSHRKTFRTYGEFVEATVRWKDPERRKKLGRPKFIDCYRDFVEGRNEIEIIGTAAIASLVPHTCTRTIGFPSIVPDVYRADVFIRELKDFEKNGGFPNLSMILLPNDHTAGTRPDMPTPKAAVADNDLALGRIVEAISHSAFWPTTCIFVVEDDPQAGVDHVDGHRTVAFVISPYTKRNEVISVPYNQTGMIRTIELILGLPPMNQLDASAVPMVECFQEKLDVTPYDAVPNRIPLDRLNPRLSQIKNPEQLYWAKKSLEMPLDEVDEAPEEIFNRILWHDAMGYETPYPVEYAYWDEEEESSEIH